MPLDPPHAKTMVFILMCLFPCGYSQNFDSRIDTAHSNVLIVGWECHVNDKVFVNFQDVLLFFGVDVQKPQKIAVGKGYDLSLTVV